MQLLRWTLVAVATAAIVRPGIARADGTTISGVVEDALLHPLAGAIVIVHDPEGHTIARKTTGHDGRFAFDGVPPGDYTVEASSPGLVGDHSHVRLGSDPVGGLELVLVNGEEVVTIEEDWAVPEPTKATGSVATVSREQVAELPGSQSRPVTDVVATQPGFVADSLGAIYARGNHANLQFRLNGVPVPDSVGSVLAAGIPARLIDRLAIYTGGMPAEFGDRLGAVIDVTTRAIADHPEGNLTARYGTFETMDLGGTYSAPLGQHSGVIASGSMVATERALDPPSISPILHDNGVMGRAFGNAFWMPCDANSYQLLATYAHNHFDIPLDPSAAPYNANLPNGGRAPDQYGNDAPAFIPHNTDGSETEDELFVAGSFVHKLSLTSAGTTAQLQVAPLYKYSRGALYSDATHALGPLADPGATASDVTRVAHHVGGVAALTYVTGGHELKAGAQVDFLHGTTSYTAYARDDLNGGGIDPTMTASGVDRTDALSTGLYVQDHVPIGALTLDAGLRADELHVMLQGGGHDDSFGVSPRLGASWAATPDIALHAFTGINWQPPSPLDAASAARVLGVVPPTTQVTYDLKPETDAVGELGISARVIKPLRLGLTGWGRYAWNQLDDTAIGSTSLVSNYNFERGRAAGLEASADLRVGPWLNAFGNGTYGFAQGRGISSAKYLFDAATLASTSWQTLDHAQTWTANAGATVHDTRFALTGVIAYGSGLRTGPDNQSHVPGHLRTDVSMSYSFTPRGYMVRVAVDIINIGDARYAYRIGNGFVGSSYGAPRSTFLSISLPLAAEAHHRGE